MNRAALILALIPLSACAAIPDASTLPPLPAEQQAFWDALESHCGKAYAGSLASEDAREGPRAFMEKRPPVYRGR